MSKPVVAQHDEPQGSVRTYTVGFALSLVLTLTAYVLTVHGAFSGWALVAVLAALAIVQLMVQLVCFLHVGREARPRWNLTVMLFAVMVVCILVFGSLWIMKNLQYGHNHGAETPGTDQLIIQDEGYQQ